jgi:putative ABC transport system substrate-binding protein
MRRRDFIKGIAVSTAAWSIAARAQQAMPVVGLLSAVSLESYADRLASIRAGLGTAGFVEGRNLSILYRSGDGQYEQLPALAADLVRRHVAVIVAVGTAAPALAAKDATGTIPIVFALGTDPVAAGLVVSLNQPGANVTGASQNNNALGPKRLELIHELMPSARSIAFLVNPNNPRTEADSKEIMATARNVGSELEVLNAISQQEIDAAFATMTRKRIQALIVHNDAFLNSQRNQIVELAGRHALPAIYAAREYVERGGLISYAPNFREIFFQAGIYAGRILKGDKPAELPVVQPTKFELLINLKASKALGPIADEVIE